MNTIRDLIAASLRKLGVLAAGETMSNATSADALSALQIMVDDMANESLLIPVSAQLSKAVDPGNVDYTVGVWPSGSPPDNHIETAKPIQYLSIYSRDSSSTDTLIRIIPQNQHAQIAHKLLTGRPTRVYVRDGWPLDTLSFDAAAYDSSDTIKINCLLPLSSYLTTNSLNDVIDMPPGYKRMLVYNLCVDLAPEWEKKVSREIAAVAASSKRNLKNANLTVGKLRSDAPRSSYGRGGFYDVNGGPVR